MKSASIVRRCRAHLDRLAKRRLSAREFCSAANNKFKVIVESPRNIQDRPAGRPDTPSRPVATRVTNNSIQLAPLCQTDLNRLFVWVTLHESWHRESLGRGEEVRYLDLISKDHHLGRFQQRYHVISDLQAKLGGRLGRND